MSDTVEVQKPLAEEKEKQTSEQKLPEEEKAPQAPKPEPKKPDILLKQKKFPPSSEFVQFIYELDEDELYEEVKDWD